MLEARILVINDKCVNEMPDEPLVVGLDTYRGPT